MSCCGSLGERELALQEERTMLIAAWPTSTIQRLLPILVWLPAYRRQWLLPDILDGLAVWAVMVPEGMAYSGIVGVPPIMGLYTIVPPLIVYALLGTSRLLVVGPDTATGLISALKKLQADQAVVHTATRATAQLWIESPLDREPGHRGAKLNSAFDTHPPLAERIAILEAM